MVPVIGLLILIIAVVLFQVYRSQEGFWAESADVFLMNTNTTVQDLLNNLKRTFEYGKANQTLKQQIESLPNQITLSTAEAALVKDLGLDVEANKPTDRALLTSLVQSTLNVDQLEPVIKKIEAELAAKTVQPTDKIFDLQKKEKPELTAAKFQEQSNFNNFREQQYAKTKKLFELMKQERFRSTATPTTTSASTGAAAAPAAGTTGNMVDVSQIYTALQGYKPSVAAAAATAPAVSDTAIKAMEDRLTSSIGKLIKDEMLAQRSFAEKNDGGCTGSISEATAQGAEYKSTLPPAPAPDMSQYIRKDSIPCWGCTLPS